MREEINGKGAKFFQKAVEDFTLPTDEQIGAWLARLPKFEAHDLRSIINEAKANGK